MNSETLVTQFVKDPGSVFVAIIRTSPTPIPAQGVKRQLMDEGVKRDDIDRQWKRIQPLIKLHPQIAMTNNKYEWLAERRSAQSSLNLLAGRVTARVPMWLTAPWVQNVADALVRAGADDSGWAEHQFQQARLVADLAVAIEVLQERGDTIVEVARLFAEEARRKRLWQLGKPGDTVSFDPDAHEAEIEAPMPGVDVRVVRPGYIWRGGGEPIVAAKAAVVV